MVNNKIKNKNSVVIGIIFVASLALLIQLPTMATDHHAYALTRYFNCVTDKADNHGSLSMTDIVRCYDSVFKGAQGSDEFGHKLK